MHRLIKIIDRTLDVVFSRFGRNSFTITLRQSRRRTGSLYLVIIHRLRETPLGFYQRVIVNEFHPNLEKTTSSVSVLYIILINLVVPSICIMVAERLMGAHRSSKNIYCV